MISRKEKLISFLKIKNPTYTQIVGVLKLLIKDHLLLTEDNYEIDSLSGKKTIHYEGIGIEEYWDKVAKNWIDLEEGDKDGTSKDRTDINFDRKLKKGY